MEWVRCDACAHLGPARPCTQIDRRWEDEDPVSSHGRAPDAGLVLGGKPAARGSAGWPACTSSSRHGGGRPCRGVLARTRPRADCCGGGGVHTGGRSLPPCCPRRRGAWCCVVGLHHTHAPRTVARSHWAGRSAGGCGWTAIPEARGRVPARRWRARALHAAQGGRPCLQGPGPRGSVRQQGAASRDAEGRGRGGRRAPLSWPLATLPRPPTPCAAHGAGDEDPGTGGRCAGQAAGPPHGEPPRQTRARVGGGGKRRPFVAAGAAADACPWQDGAVDPGPDACHAWHACAGHLRAPLTRPRRVQGGRPCDAARWHGRGRSAAARESGGGLGRAECPAGRAAQACVHRAGAVVASHAGPGDARGTGRIPGGAEGRAPGDGPAGEAPLARKHAPRCPARVPAGWLAPERGLPHRGAGWRSRDGRRRPGDGLATGARGQARGGPLLSQRLQDPRLAQGVAAGGGAEPEGLGAGKGAARGRAAAPQSWSRLSLALAGLHRSTFPRNLAKPLELELGMPLMRGLCLQGGGRGQ